MREDIQFPYIRQEKKRRNLSKNESLSSKNSNSQKLSTIEKLHQPDTSFVCLSNIAKSGIIS